MAIIIKMAGHAGQWSQRGLCLPAIKRLGKFEKWAQRFLHFTQSLISLDHLELQRYFG